MVSSVTIDLWSLNNRRPLGKGKKGSPKVYSDQSKVGAHNPKVVSSSLRPLPTKRPPSVSNQGYTGGLLICIQNIPKAQIVEKSKRAACDHALCRFAVVVIESSRDRHCYVRGRRRRVRFDKVGQVRQDHAYKVVNRGGVYVPIVTHS